MSEFMHWGITEIPLKTTALKAMIVVERHGQQDIEEGDDVKVSVKLYLPKDRAYLHSEIRFKHRCCIFKENLTVGWGNNSKDYEGYAYREAFHVAPTWDKAANDAWEYALRELQKLQDMLVARAQALIEAERDVEEVNDIPEETSWCAYCQRDVTTKDIESCPCSGCPLRWKEREEENV